MSHLVKRTGSKQFATVVLAVSSLLSLPTLASAGALWDGVGCNGPTCSSCNVVALANNVLAWLFGFALIIFMYMMVFAGLKLVTSGGNPEGRSYAKGKFIDAVIGLIIVMGAWLIVDTLVKTIVSDTGNVEGVFWAQVECYYQADLAEMQDAFDYIETRPEPAGALAGTYTYTDPNTGAVVTVPIGDSGLAGDGLSDADAKAYLDDAGIEYKGSVSGEGVKPHVISQLIALDQACGCDITITSLTDGNHASGEFSHGSGFKADIRSTGGGDPNPELVQYVQSLPSAGSWSDGTQLYYDANACATYAVESDHIDVQYKTGC